MQMPSLFKYFAFVGVALLALISLANFLLEPSTGATVMSQKQPAKPAVAVQHDPRASKIERWRNEQAALKSTISEPAPATTAATKATYQPEPAVTEAAKPAVQAAAASAPVATTEDPAAPAMQTTDVSANIAADEIARAEQAKAEKIKAAKARKARLARERAKAEQQQQQAGANGGQFYGGYNGGQFYGAPPQRNASNQQDQYYYGQRVPQQRQTLNAYAPRQNYGPFGW